MAGKVDSWLVGHGFEYHPILDGNDVKAMPESIPAPNPGSFNNWKESLFRGQSYKCSSGVLKPACVLIF